MSALIKRLIYPTLVVLFFVGVWALYLQTEPGPVMVDRVDYIIFDGNYMIDAVPGGEPREYLKIIRDPELIRQIVPLFINNKYRKTDCACMSRISLSFVQAPNQSTTWGFIGRHVPVEVIHHWFAIKKLLARELDPSFGERFYSYEIEIPDAMPVATLRAALNDKDWIIFPQAGPVPGRSLKSAATPSAGEAARISYLFRVGYRDGDPAAAEKALRAKLPGVIAIRIWNSRHAF